MNPNSMTNERLCTLAQKGDEAAREILVEKNMGFIVQTADLIYRSSSLEGSDLNIDVDDLVQEGSIGLLRAVDGFDPARKLKFLTYAAPAIKNAMLDLVHTAQMSFEYRMATVKVKDGVEGLGLERVYLDEILPSDERLLRIEAIADPYALPPEQAFIKAENLWELYAALDKLEPREQTYLAVSFRLHGRYRAHADRCGDTFSSEREPDKAAGGTVAGYASEGDAVRQRNVAAAGRGLLYTSASFSGQSDFASQKSCVCAVAHITKSACPTAAKKRLLPHSAAPQSTPPTPFPRQPEAKV